jgi:hypothetical protein
VSGRRALVALFVLSLPFVTPKIRGADEIEYFSYLRSLSFDHDLEFGDEYAHFYAQDPQGLRGFKDTFLERREPDTGRHINFAPLGSALLWAPAYALAHLGVLLARALGSSVPADGFSLPYVAAACYASVLLGLLGLLLTHDALRRFGAADEGMATLAVAGLWLATPLLYYMTIGPAFSHASSVFAVALVVWLSLRAAARERTTALDWAAAGAAVGLAALVREQDGLYGLLPGGLLLVEAWRSRRPGDALAKAVALGGAAFACFVPQLLAYRVLNGHYGPSHLVARKMTWTSPHFLAVLFDPGHGLFLWSPLLLVATLGLLLPFDRGRGPTRAVLALAFLVQVWINGAVESWSQAGAFGSRRFVSATPVLAFGLAAALAWLRPRLGGRALAAALAVCVWWNASLMVQFGLKLMDRQRLEWPRVAVNQLSEVPPRLGHSLWLFFTDRERLVKEGR